MELQTLRHTMAHIFAQALKRIYKDVKLAIGPAIRDGFYYDVDMEHKLSSGDFKKIEKEMKHIISQKFPIEFKELTRDEALSLMKNQPYKTALINDIPDGERITAYSQGEYIEVCRGPHINNTNDANPHAFKLLSVAGAYWRGSEKNQMLQRVYGTAFETKKDLDDYLNIIEESKKRDHRKLGKELDLFAFMDEARGFPFFLPKGKVLRNELETYWREIHKKFSYEEISTPLILSEELWHQSGHWDHYKDNMYSTKIDDKDYAVKPMNCPGAVLVFKLKPHSYKELPMKLAELGLVHRHENSGNLHGLMRVRCFTQDDAHIFMTHEQIRDQIIEVIDLIDSVYKKVGFKYQVELSTRPESSMGSDEDWETATNSLKQALHEKGIKYKINEGDGAFYGPKIDFHLEDCLKRTWQCGTVQLDFQMPERFNLTYTGKDGKKHQPVMIHRVVFGSIERFIGILTEHTMAKFPVWLSPVQVEVLPISEKHTSFAKDVMKELEKNNIRAELDNTSNTFGKKMRDFALRKSPYAIIIGDNEVSKNIVTIKKRNSMSQQTIKLSEFVKNILDEIKKRDSDSGSEILSKNKVSTNI